MADILSVSLLLLAIKVENVVGISKVDVDEMELGVMALSSVTDVVSPTKAELLPVDESVTANVPVSLAETSVEMILSLGVI